MVRDTDYDDQKDEPTRPLNEDYDTPFSQPDDAKQTLPADYPAKDDGVDEHEEYDEGTDDAALDNKPEGGEPGAGPRPQKMF